MENNMKKYSSRVKKALEKLSYSELIKVYEYKDCVEVVVNRWGDVCTYRVYDNGKVCER